MSLSSSDTPPIRSAAFSRSASQRAASLVAPRSESTYTDAPVIAAIADRIRVHGDEHVGLRDARAPDAIAQHEEVVAVAGEHGAHAGLGVDAVRERARDGEHHILFARAVAADRAGILPAVAGIDGDDDVAIAVDRRMRGAHRTSAVERRRPRWRRSARRARLLSERDDQTARARCPRQRREPLRTRRVSRDIQLPSTTRNVPLARCARANRRRRDRCPSAGARRSRVACCADR